MRKLPILFLIGLLTACPALCRAVEVAHDLGCCEASDGKSCDPQTSDPCPDDGSNCICGGAVQADHARIPDLDPIAASPPWDPAFGPIGQQFAILLGQHLARDGRPAGLAGWRDLSTVCALLQNFRC